MTNVVTKARHLALRIGRRTGEMLLTLVVKDWDLPGIAVQAQEWLNRYPQLVGISVNLVTLNAQMPSLVVKPVVLLGELTYWSSLLA